MDEKRVRIYLEDHLAGSTAGLELAKRAAKANKENEYGRELREFIEQLHQERSILDNLLKSFGGRPNPVKQGGAWVGEKLGRLKLNGSITGYSPLSRLVELEGLVIGVAGKLELWRSLIAASDRESRLSDVDLKRLARQAEVQRKMLKALHDRAAREAFAADRASAQA